MPGISDTIGFLILKNTMLGKLNYFKAQNGIPYAVEAEYRAVATVFKAYCRKQKYDAILEAGTKGTLGVNFFCHGFPGGICFIKSHHPGERYRDSLEKEYILLKAVNQRTLHVDILRLQLHDKEQVYLVMDVLREVPEVTPAEVSDIIKQYQKHLAHTRVEGLYDIDNLVAAAWNELYMLRERGFFTMQTFMTAADELQLLQRQLPTIERCICHGDLGDRNIMLNDDGKMITIDWEDAFWGCAEYDYLYWLTFFNHRKFYQQNCLSAVEMDPERARAIITMIIIIKSAISYYSGSYHSNSVSIENRLLDAWKLWKTDI